MTRELVEQIVDRAWRRGFDQRRLADRIEDFGAQCERMAALWERQARWWAVLARHADSGLYRRAVLDSLTLCAERAERYRKYAASAVEQDKRAAERAAGCAA